MSYKKFISLSIIMAIFVISKPLWAPTYAVKVVDGKVVVEELYRVRPSETFQDIGALPNGQYVCVPYAGGNNQSGIRVKRGSQKSDIDLEIQEEVR